MSYFDDASLVMIPSGYKTSKVYSVKPTDGSGDLTFSRSNDTATRVNSAGLIEKVRTNLVTYSNTFSDAAWTKTYVQAPTANAIANPLTGAVDAWKLVEDATNNFHYIIQSPTFAAGEVSFSFYAKSAERTTCSAFLSQSGNFGASFNLSTGVATASGTGSTASMVSVGGGWYRCIVTNNGSSTVANQVRIGVADGALSSYAGDGTSGIYIYAAQAEQGVATNYIATTSAAVSVGPVANVPRLDYLNSSCPRLLLEPQRTNLFTYSEQLDNAAWTKYNLGVTANATISPDGYQNADKIFCNITGSAVPLIHQSPSYTNTTSTVSGYFKKAEYNFVVIHAFGIAGTVFNLNTGTIVSGTGTITSVGNGWYRCVAVLNIGSDSQTFFTPSVDGSVGYTGTSGSGVFAWGAQAEASVSYATSYIPTLGAAVTRGADACSKTGISSLIGQTEGTIFLDFTASTNGTGTNVVFMASDGTTNNRVQFEFSGATTANYIVSSGGSLSVLLTSLPFVQGQRYKIAMAYKANDFVIYSNGVSVGTDTSGAAPVSMTQIEFSEGSSYPYSGRIAETLLFKTRLTNAQLAELTTL